MSENEDDIAERIGNEREAEMKKQQEQNKKIYMRKYMREYMREYKPETKSYKRGPYKPRVEEAVKTS